MEGDLVRHEKRQPGFGGEAPMNAAHPSAGVDLEQVNMSLRSSMSSPGGARDVDQNRHANSFSLGVSNQLAGRVHVPAPSTV